MISYIISDIEDTLVFCKLGLLVALVFVSVRFFHSLLRGRSFDWRSVTKQSILVFYIVMVMEIAFFSREPGSRNTIDFQLFHTWGKTAHAHAWVVENILMFIPFGVLVPVCVKHARMFPVTLLLAFFCSAGLEYIQFLTERGHCQLDDVVMNTIGGVIGWLLWAGFNAWRSR